MRVLEPLVAAAALCCSSARAADWAVVLSGGASNAEAAAATRLSAELGDACGGGVALPIVADPADLAGRGALAVGRGAFESVTSAPAPDDDALGPQGYILDASSDGEWIGMAGGAAAGPGAHYAVEDFLQRLGARYYAPGVEVPPSCDYILPERVVVVPIFSMRSSYVTVRREMEGPVSGGGSKTSAHQCGRVLPSLLRAARDHSRPAPGTSK